MTSNSYVRQGVIRVVSVLMNFVVMSLGVSGSQPFSMVHSGEWRWLMSLVKSWACSKL